ncbi:hypothetical protein VCR14J2_610208 [Vibrio coralliirubri]|nr:hypothetical protein VCR3J2_320195 [Vibrio coralliirubri]CDU08105.1 hypothetical protein VCR14J2_610208 [Vibrio coralliirubri]
MSIFFYPIELELRRSSVNRFHVCLIIFFTTQHTFRETRSFK